MLARRELMGLAAGGVAALAGGGRAATNTARAAGRLPPPSPMSLGGDARASSLEDAAYKLLRGKIDDANLAHDRKVRRLGRLKSVSQAFVDAQYASHNSLITTLYRQLSEAS